MYSSLTAKYRHKYCSRKSAVTPAAQPGRLGKQPPRYRFLLNPFRDRRFAICPSCDRRTLLRKVPHYLDLETGQIVAITDEIRDEHSVDDNAFAAALQQRDLPAWMREALDQAHQVEQGYGERYIAIPAADSREGYRAMEGFIETVADRRLQAQLVHAIQGRGAFRRFKDVLLTHPDEREDRFAFSTARVRERMLAWLAEEGIKVATKAGEGIRSLADRQQEESDER